MGTDLQAVEIPNALAVRVNALQVFDDESLAEARAAALDIKALKKSIEDFYKPLVEQAHAAHKALTTSRADNIKPLDAMEAMIKQRMLAYSTAKAQAEAEAQRQAAAALRAQAMEQERAAAALRAEAEEAARFGAKDLAAELLEDANKQEVQAFAATKHAAAIKPGQPEGTRAVWKWRVTDHAAIPRQYLVPDKDQMDYLATKKKGEANIPGIEFYPEYIQTVRA